MRTIRDLGFSVLSLSTAAGCVCAFMLGGPVHADEVASTTSSSSTSTTTTGVGNYNVPVSDTTTRETIVDQGAPKEQVTKKHTVYTRLSPADASITTVETQDSNSIKYGRQNYAERLKDFRSQLDKAVSSNWISSEQAADLNSEYDKLVAEEANARSHDFPKAESDELDTRLNAFNIKLSSASSKSK